jgi:hypothetical protein
MASLFLYAEMFPDEWRMDFVYERTELRIFNPHQVETWLHEMSKASTLYARHHPYSKQRKNVFGNGMFLCSQTTVLMCALIIYVCNIILGLSALTF